MPLNFNSALRTGATFYSFKQAQNVGAVLGSKSSPVSPTTSEIERQTWNFAGTWTFGSETDGVSAALDPGLNYNAAGTQLTAQRVYWSWTVPVGYSDIGKELYINVNVSTVIADFPLTPVNFYVQTGTVANTFANCATGTNFLNVSPPSGSASNVLYNADTGIVIPSAGTKVVITAAASGDTTFNPSPPPAHRQQVCTLNNLKLFGV